jgi:hypothetical protein
MSDYGSPGSGAQGPPGPVGPQGPVGPPGPATPDISAKLTNSAPQVIPQGVSTLVHFDTPIYDTDTMSSAADRITIKRAGKFYFLVSVFFQQASVASGVYVLRIKKNGVTYVAITQGQLPAFANIGAQTAIELVCAVNDFFTVEFEGTDGTNWTSIVDSTGPFFIGRKVG